MNARSACDTCHWLCDFLSYELFAYCIATADGDLGSSGIGDILIYDFQPRNYHVMKKLHASIKNGRKVYIPPDSVSNLGKDINDLVKAGMTTMDIVKSIGYNSFQGLTAMAKFSSYNKTRIH